MSNPNSLLPFSDLRQLDNRQRPVPAGVPGELYFGGETTAAGYLNLPGETASKFIKNPFYAGGCGKMYRTGDLVRWRSDRSEMDFLGRVDNQIKLRGFRIELAEIEAVLFTVPGVKTAAVIVHVRWRDPSIFPPQTQSPTHTHTKAPPDSFERMFHATRSLCNRSAPPSARVRPHGA